MNAFRPASRLFLAMSLSFYGCAAEQSTVNNGEDDSPISISSFISTPPPDEQKALTDRDRDQAAVFEAQQSEDFREGGRRCASLEETSNEAVLRDASDCSYNGTTIRPEYNPANGDVIELQVVWHIIKKTDGTGDVPQEFIVSQMEILNEDFRAKAGTPGEPGVDAKVQFKLATRDPQGNATTGITVHTNNTWFQDPGPGAANAMKQALNWDPTKYFNIYTNDANGALGYATFPQEDAGTYQDGVVLLYSSVGRNAPEGGIYNQGRTATHEIGHYLGLFHTFQSGCGTGYTAGDRVNDTSPQSNATFNCPAEAAGASCTVNRNIKNFMNYTQDTCMNRFSAEQVNRLRCATLNYRASQINAGSEPGPGPGPQPEENEAPTANFTSSAQNLTVQFTDASQDRDGEITAWAWTFGDGQGSEQQNPSHTYAQAGTYTVNLTVADDKGELSEKTTTVTVSAATSDEALENGGTRASLGASKGEELHFYIDVPAGATNLQFNTSGGSGDADLYVRFGDKPTKSTYDYRPYKSGNTEEVKVLAPKAGRYYLMLQAYSTFSGASLKAAYTAGSGGGTGGVQTKTGTVAGKKWVDFEVKSNGQALEASATWDNAMDLDLYVYDGAGAIVASALGTSQPETVKYNPNGKAGTYFVRVYNYTSGNATANFKLELKVP